jgi:peptide/nickel transport system ATP-binding protein
MIESPKHPYTRLLVDSLPGIEVKQPLAGIPGLPPPLVDLPPGCSFNPRCPFAFDRCVRETPPLQEVGPSQFAACHLYPTHSELPPMPARSARQEAFQ